MIKWHASVEDLDVITAIVVRAASCLSLESIGSDRLTLSMDLTACHLNGCPLDLKAFLAGDQLDFVHDICGITRHIDRKTGQLTDCFDPRFAKSEVSRG